MSSFPLNPVPLSPLNSSKSRPRIAATAASALLVSLLAACGGGSADTDPVATAQAAPGAASAAATAASTVETSTVASADASDGAASAAADGTSDDDTAGTSDRAAIESAASAGATSAATAATVPAATGSGRTYVVGGTGTLVAGQTRVASMMTVPWSSLPAGSVVLVSAGTFAGVTTITATGTKANPIVVTAADPAHPPVLTNSVDFQHSSYVTVSHVTVQSPTYGGFIIRLASNHISVTDSTINRAPMAINITNAAGTGHQILRNVIADSLGDGINAEVNSNAAERTLIAHNTILRSGQHGVEVRASHYQVEYNTVALSGYANGGGISGIHLYSGSASEDSGDDNLVRYNLSYSNIDKVLADGNGIEVDQWCDHNVVSFNQTWGNDGAGIIVFDGSSNVIQNNTTWDNGHNSGGTHVSLGEIIISGTSASTVKSNSVWNNVVSSTRANVPAMYVDTRAVAGGNAVSANLYYNAAAGTLVRWTDGAVKNSSAAIDAATGHAGSVTAAPAFANTAAPLAAGLKLKAKPALNGTLPTGQLDAANATPVTGDAYFGAYYTAPATTTTATTLH